MKRVLITGGQGFIGRHLAITLAADNYDITTVDLKKPESYDPKLWTPITKDVRVLMKELDAEHQLANIYGESKPYDLIFHFAATPRVGISLEHPELVLQNNIDTLIDVLGYCRNHLETGLVFVSSGAVIWSDLRFDPYALSKHIGEELVSTYAHAFGIKATTVRLFNVYGPGEAEYGPHTTLIRQCKKALWRQVPIEIHGDGNQVRDFTHVYDVCTGLARVANELLMGEHRPVYEIDAGDGSVSVNDVVNAFLDGEEPLVRYVEGRPYDPQKTKADINLWPRNWNPSIHVLEYIKQWKKDGCPLD